MPDEIYTEQAEALRATNVFNLMTFEQKDKSSVEVNWISQLDMNSSHSGDVLQKSMHKLDKNCVEWKEALEEYLSPGPNQSS